MVQANRIYSTVAPIGRTTRYEFQRYLEHINRSPWQRIRFVAMIAASFSAGSVIVLVLS